MHIHFLYPYISGIISLLIVVVITPFFIKLANAKGWVVAPRKDRWHNKPTALLGGVPIFFGASVSFLFTESLGTFWMIYAGFLVLFLTGLVDDLREVKPVIKMIAQVIGAFILIYHGYYFGGGLLDWAGIPLTFFWVIGITNALNLLDNMDGLAAGVAGITATIAGVLGVTNGDIHIAAMAFSIAGASFGFLVYNFNPAKIFMGDCGSLFLGFAISFLSIAVQKNMGSSSSLLVMLVPVSIMAIPIMDTTLVTIKRLVAGRRIDQGGRDHSSHRLVALGLSEKKAVLILYGISIAWGVLCVVMLTTAVNNLFLVVLLFAALTFVFSIILSKVKVYNETEEKLIYLRSRGFDAKGKNNLFLRFLLMNKKLIGGICADILIIYFSFFIAAKATHTNVEGRYALLALFIVIKIGFFYIANLYNRMWRYMTVMELGGYFIATCCSSILIVLALLMDGRLFQYSGYFFLVDFLVTFTGVLLIRLSFRTLIDYINKGRQVKKRVLIYGAGDSGFLLVKELLQNRKHELTPVGWIDDDVSKQNMFLYGYKIFGSKNVIVTICKTHKIDSLLIASNSISLETENQLKADLATLNIQVGRFSVQLHF